MLDKKDRSKHSESYWQPSLRGFSSISLSKSTHKEKILKSFVRFLHFLLYYALRKVFSLHKGVFSFIKGSLKFKDSVRWFVIRRLISRRNRLFRPTSHALVLSISFGLLFMGGGAGNIILGRGVAQDVEYYYEDDAVEGVSSTETLVPEGRPGEETLKYTVKEGDTLIGIGEKFKVSAESIRYANDLGNSDNLTVGEELTIPPVSGVVRVVQDGDTVESLAKKFNVPPQAIVDFNYLEEPFTLAVGEEVIIPDAKIPAPAPATPSTPTTGNQYAAAPANPNVSGSGQFTWPTNHRYITQFFSGWHPALDIAKYSSVFAADGGTVVEASSNGSWNWGYGNYVKIDHGNGYTTMYAHLSGLHVSAGDTVSQGQSIGTMGNTGRSFGTHLHFVVQLNGRYINPLSVL